MLRQVVHLPFLLMLAVVVSGWAPQAVADEPKSPLVGDWQGAIKVGGIELRLVFHFTQAADGKLGGTLDSVDQGAKGLPIDSVAASGNAVNADMKLLRATFEGQLSSDSQSVEGKFTQAGSALPLTLKKLDKPFALNRPQEPKGPFPYRQEEVTFDSPKGNAKLAGTLTLPEGKNLPAVVLISGSGPQDRDEMLMGHRPFMVLADYLSRRGIAVLRYDDRGCFKSTGDYATATTLDFKDDALAALAFLKTRPEINAKKIGLCGHSEGGLVAPIAAVESPDVAFIVLMAGPGVSGEQILYRQGDLIARAAGASEKDIAAQLAIQKAAFDALRGETDPAKAIEKVKKAVDAALTEDDRKAMAAAGTKAEDQFKALTTPWFRYFLFYEPHTNLTKVTCPVLAVNGGKDLQVDPAQNLPELAKHLAANKDVTIKEFPGLNHLFQTCQTGGVGEYGQIEETMSPAVLAAIADWIVSHTKQ